VARTVFPERPAGRWGPRSGRRGTPDEQAVTLRFTLPINDVRNAVSPVAAQADEVLRESRLSLKYDVCDVARTDYGPTCDHPDFIL